MIAIEIGSRKESPVAEGIYVYNHQNGMIKPRTIVLSITNKEKLTEDE